MKISLPALQKALMNPGIYPDHPGEVGFLETHISLLFFTGRHVYKVKKPVDFGFLDFTTLDKRRHFCEEEVRLNRRLSPEIYHGVVRMTYDGDRLSLEGQGEVVEYAVKMKQISEDRLMDRLLKENRVTGEMVAALSERLSAFYRSAETSERIRGFARPERVKQDTDENFEQTAKYVGVALPGDAYSEIKQRTNDFFKFREGLFHDRIAEGRIRDCHGDLRLEHIFWGDDISIFDCIEFNERFRYTDVAADLAFLAMDFDYQGREDLSGDLIRCYVEKSQDMGLLKMLDFYKCYRAYVRGKVESFRLDDPNIPEKEKKEALQRAQKYFALSRRYASNIL